MSKVQNFDKISEFCQNIITFVKISVSRRDFDIFMFMNRLLSSHRNFRILPKFQNFAKISKFYQNLKILPKFQNLLCMLVGFSMFIKIMFSSFIRSHSGCIEKCWRWGNGSCLQFFKYYKWGWGGKVWYMAFVKHCVQIHNS